MKATVYSRLDALQAHDKEKVLISIGCVGYIYEPVAHQDDWHDIIVLAFDDTTPDKIAKDNRILEVPMIMEQAIQCNSFISKHLNRDFVIHCDAGMSRSVAVGSYMANYYKYDVEYTVTGTDWSKNIHVYNLLGRINYHSAFGDIDD